MDCGKDIHALRLSSFAEAPAGRRPDAPPSARRRLEPGLEGLAFFLLVVPERDPECGFQRRQPHARPGEILNMRGDVVVAPGLPLLDRIAVGPSRRAMRRGYK